MVPTVSQILTKNENFSENQNKTGASYGNYVATCVHMPSKV